ncbi:TniQ family protein, partial [Brevibacillus reuszeri]|nr:TniQ family protein [Brevibacillus reuszeri]
MNQPIKLLCTPQPLPDESFMGYIIRLSQENRCESLIWIFKLANIKTNPPNNKSNKLTETDYGNLSALTGLTINALKLLSFEVVESVAAACNAPHCQ